MEKHTWKLFIPCKDSSENYIAMLSIATTVHVYIYLVTASNRKFPTNYILKKLGRLGPVSSMKDLKFHYLHCCIAQHATFLTVLHLCSRGRRKQFFSGQANQLQSYVYREFRVKGGHKCKLLCEAQSANACMHSMLMLEGLGACPQEKFENRSS